jgi:hypothetical protein
MLPTSKVLVAWTISDLLVQALRQP